MAQIFDENFSLKALIPEYLWNSEDGVSKTSCSKKISNRIKLLYLYPNPSLRDSGTTSFESHLDFPISMSVGTMAVWGNWEPRVCHFITVQGLPL